MLVSGNTNNAHTERNFFRQLTFHVSLQSVPRFSRSVDRSHLLYRRHKAAHKDGGAGIAATLRDLENQCIDETQVILAALTPEKMQELDDLFKDCVDSELKFYK